MTEPLQLDGHSLDLDALERAAAGAPAAIDAAAMARAATSHQNAAEVSTTRPVYGRTTGVGAARDESTDSKVDHGLRLLRSHAAGWGEVMPPAVVRAALAVRANQILAGGSGATPALAQALADLVGAPDADLPVVHRYGSLGTGDLTALAEVGLALIGERERAGGARRADVQLTSADALPLMSSNAFAIAEAGLHAASLHELARARGIDDSFVTLGSLHGDALMTALEHSHVFVSTSVIEGYPLALVEAQALGMPLVMYELPWLATLHGNAGVVSVSPGDRREAAQALAKLAADPVAYQALSIGAAAAAQRALGHDFGSLYVGLVRGSLGPEHSPEPSTSNMRLLLDQSVNFTEGLILRQGRAIRAAREDARDQRKKANGLSGELDGARAFARAAAEADALKRTVPSVASTGLKGWLQRFLPASMRQAGFYARHQHSMATRQHDQLLATQAEVREHLGRIEANVAASRTAHEELTHAIQALTVRGSELEAERERARLADERMASLEATVTDLAEQVRQGTAAASESLQLQERAARAAGRTGRAVDEVVWGAVFHDTVTGSEWFTDRRLSPGRWAVGYPFLYVLYRVLDEVQPSSVLELGLGHSTKVVAQYAKHNSRARHVVVEHDAGWIETFAANYVLSTETCLIELPLAQASSPSGSVVQRYDGFASAVGADVYDLIIIDGPFGYDQDLARIDILDVLPGSLGRRFVIMLDDAHRPGEQAAIELIVRALDRANITHMARTYRGQKDVWVAVSTDLAFLTTL